MKTIRIIALTSLLAAAAAGCSEGAATSPDGGGAAGTGAAGTGAAGTSGACNTLTQLGVVVAPMAVNDALPVMSGGSIADGTYVLTSNIAYAGHTADNKTRRRTVKFTGNKLEVVNSDDGGPDVHVDFMFTTAGTDIVQTLGCGGGKASTLGYTATATSFVTATKGNDEGWIVTYTKQ